MRTTRPATTAPWRVAWAAALLFLPHILVPRVSAAPLESYYDEGFWFVAPDDKLHLGGWAQTDGRLLARGHPGGATFSNRRARIYAAGHLENDFAYLIMVALERPLSPLQFAWLEYSRAPGFGLRIGQFKEPFSLEELTADLYQDLIERSMGTSNLSPAQDIGVMAHGKLFKNGLEYAAGFFNGRGKNEQDNTDHKDFAGRLTLFPFSGLESSWIQNLAVAVNGTIGHQNEDLSKKAFTTAGGTRFWAYDDSGISMADERSRLGTDLEWRMGRASVKGEWTRTAFRGVTKGVLREDAIFDAWYISAGFFLTGEKKPRGQAVKPRKRWGALEVALRYEEFWGRQALLDKGFATGTDRVRAIGSGLNWTPNKHIRLGLNHIHPFFGDPVSMGGKKLNGEDVFLFRTQFEF